MTRPTPPPHVYALPAIELEELADATAALVREARQDGRIIPASINIQGYGTPTISLFISESDTPDIWTALQHWASRYGTALRHSPAGADGTKTRAELSWMTDGIRFEAHSQISAPEPDPWAGSDDSADWTDPNPAA